MSRYLRMSKYIENFVSGHGITFEKSRRNLEAFEKASQLWRDIETSLGIDGTSIVMLCGAKNNGKSSLVRYLVNHYNHPRGMPDDSDEFHDIDGANSSASYTSDPTRFAYFVNFDPGQPEMTSPGMISAHIIKATEMPLQSPTYQNLHHHEALTMASVGGINMSVNPRMYIDNCRYVFKKVREHHTESKYKAPIFINTMGHIRNVGLAMQMDLIKICRPTNLIVLNVESDPMRTIYADLSPHAMDSQRAAFYYETNQQSHRKLNYQYDVYNLQFSFVDSSSIATKNRTALQIAYMASIPEALYKPIMQVAAKWISFDTVSIYCVSSYPLKEGIVLELLLHSWVHLVKMRKYSIPTQSASSASTSPTSTHDNNENRAQEVAHQSTGQSAKICNLIDDVSENELFGCGIVAEIDLVKRRFAIITPLDQETLDSRIDCVIKPLSIQVPREMIQDGY